MTRTSPLLLLLLVVVVAVLSEPITEELNAALQSKCGRKSYQRKIINGVPVDVGEHPWAVSVYVSATEDTFVGPGTVISPRHIIAFNVVRSKGDHLQVIDRNITAAGTCEGDHLILPTSANELFDADFEYLKKFNGTRKFTGSVARVIVVNGCKTLNNHNLLIVELIHNLKFSKDQRPACLSNSPHNWNAVDTFTMYGVNKTGILLSGQFAPVNCSASFPFSCAKSVSSHQGLCTGDFGGSAVVSIDDKFTVVGVYSKGNLKCNRDPARIENYQFINVGHFRKAICQLTGVCAAAPPSEETTAANAADAPILTSAAVGEPILVTEAPIVTSSAVGEPIYATEDSDTREGEVVKNTTTTTTDGVLVGELVAETFDKLKLKDGCSSRETELSGHVKNIHIHIHLNEKK